MGSHFQKSNHYYSIRLKNWSAPAIFSVLIIICMFIIYCCETLGIAHKENNLVYRLNTIDGIHLNSKQKENGFYNLLEEHSEPLVNSIIYQKEKEKRYHKIVNILITGMTNQLLYELNK